MTNTKVNLKKPTLPTHFTQEVFVYRGVHGAHPAIEEARAGRVAPGDPEGNVTPEQHNAGGVSGKSQFTSWSYEYDVAYTFATDRIPPGVVLRLRKTASDQTWVQSPDVYGAEREVLMLGSTNDAEVIFGRHKKSDSA